MPFLESMNLPVFDASYEWNHVSFCDGLMFYLAPYPQGSFTSLQNCTMSFFLMAEQYCDVCLCHIFFVHLLTDISVVSTCKGFFMFLPSAMGSDWIVLGRWGDSDLIYI